MLVHILNTMHTKRCFVVLIIFLSCVASLTGIAGNVPAKPFTVIIDPGHGGQDPGAVYKNIREKDIVLKLGLKLGEEIKQNLPGTKVIFTRDRDVFIPLHQRAAIANKSKADLFISLHANFCGAPSISGTETFVLGLHRSEENLEVAKKENSVILMEEDYSARYEGFDPNSSESYIMFEMVQDEYLDQSISIADLVQDQFRNNANRKNRGVKQAGFLVLRQTGMPSILIESGFLSNPSEAQYLNSEEGQNNLAYSIFKAFKQYKSLIEDKSNFNVVDHTDIHPDNETNIDKTVLAESSQQEEAIAKPEKTPAISFSIQLAVTSSNVNPAPANFKGLRNVFVIRQGDKYKYYYGQESSYEEIQKTKNEVLKKFPGAFVVAFEDENQIPLRKALQKLKR